MVTPQSLRGAKRRGNPTPAPFLPELFALASVSDSKAAWRAVRLSSFTTICGTCR